MLGALNMGFELKQGVGRTAYRRDHGHGFKLGESVCNVRPRGRANGQLGVIFGAGVELLNP